MITVFIKAAFSITVIMGGWLLVQTFWKNISGASSRQDALAGRMGCQSCECHAKCENTK